jgi:GNAT superfamily N-acetyltransferase
VRSHLRYQAAMSICIRLATRSDAVLLPAIEASAGALFRTLADLAWIADEPIGTADEFLPLIAAGTVWVADEADAGLVGELRGEIFDDALHIAELAVAMAFQRRGLGRRLLDAAAGAARARGMRSLTLTTFRHVAWNAPFYARYGFVELSGAKLDARLRETVRAEEARGLPNRCAMRLTLD